MRALGIDIGSLTTKAVILNDSDILASTIITSGDEAELSAKTAVEEALSQAGLTFDNDLYIVSTGVAKYGEKRA